MSALSDYTEAAFANWLRGNANMPATTTRYLALYTTATTDAGGGTEVTGGGYARQSFTMTAPTDGVMSNGSQISFGTASADWGTVTHFCVRDAATLGNAIWHGPLTAPKTIQNGDPVTVEIGALGVTVA